MNVRTTLFLAISLAVLGIAYLWRPQAQPAPTGGSLTPSRTPASTVTTDLFETALGDVVKITVSRVGQDEWVFEKQTEEGNANQYSWRMIKPQALAVDKYQIDRIERALTQMQYEVSFKPGSDGGMTSADAGLDPAATVIAITDDQGRMETIEIGKPASDSTHYVRVVGRDDIIVGKGSLRDLIKRRPVDYLSTQLWTITNQNVRRIEITDRSHGDKAIQYVFIRDGAGWQMQSPAVAKATKRVSDLVAALARLRVTKWVDDNADAFGAYGLDHAAYTIRLIEEQQISKTDDAQPSDATDADSPEEQEVQTRINKYVLHLSKQSPIGEDSTVYVRTDRGAAVGTIMKSVADKCMPVMSQWRDMKVTDANVTTATRVELTTPQGAAIMLGESDGWRFENGDGAESDTVMDMLAALAELEAVSFVDFSTGDLATFGLDAPQAQLRLTLPGSDQIERVTIGSFTDRRAKRLVYLRRNEATSIAKVKIADVQKLLRAPRAYRDRSIISIDSQRFSSLTMTTRTPYADQPFVYTFEKMFGQWAMTAPTKHAIRQSQFNSLLDILGSLKATSLVADASQITSFGLQEPAIRMDIVCQSPDESFTLLVTDHDGQYYAKREDGDVIYQVANAVYKQAMLEFREEKVFDFSEDDVTQFSIASGDTVHEFVRADDTWTYRWEPDLPLDQAKVKNLLLKVRDIRTDRFVAYGVTEPSPYGLSNPARQVSVKLGDGRSVSLSIAGKVCPGDPGKGYFARIDDRDEIFLIKPTEAARLTVSLDELE